MSLYFKPTLKIVVSSVFLIGLFLGVVTTVNAQVRVEQLDVDFANDFVLEPTKNEVIIDPGQTAKRNISVTNRTERTVDFKIEIEDITGSDNKEDSVKLLGDERGPYSLRDFLAPEVGTFTLLPGQRITIPVNVALPINAEPGGYYGAVIISAVDRDEDGEQDEVTGVTKIITRVGSLFLVRVNGEVEEASSIAAFKALGPKQAVYAKHPEGFEVGVRNEGNVHLVHFGEVVITNMFGKTITTLPMDAFFSLPQSTRFRDALWADSFAFGYYRAEVQLHKGFGNEDNFEKASVSFWVLPWNIILGAIAIIVILIVLVQLFRRTFELKKKEK